MITAKRVEPGHYVSEYDGHEIEVKNQHLTGIEPCDPDTWEAFVDGEFVDRAVDSEMALMLAVMFITTAS